MHVPSWRRQWKLVASTPSFTEMIWTKWMSLIGFGEFSVSSRNFILLQIYAPFVTYFCWPILSTQQPKKMAKCYDTNQIGLHSQSGRPLRLCNAPYTRTSFFCCWLPSSRLFTLLLVHRHDGYLDFVVAECLILANSIENM